MSTLLFLAVSLFKTQYFRLVSARVHELSVMPFSLHTIQYFVNQHCVRWRNTTSRTASSHRLCMIYYSVFYHRDTAPAAATNASANVTESAGTAFDAGDPSSCPSAVMEPSEVTEPASHVPNSMMSSHSPCSSTTASGSAHVPTSS